MDFFGGIYCSRLQEAFYSGVLPSFEITMLLGRIQLLERKHTEAQSFSQTWADIPVGQSPFTAELEHHDT